jgi:hypothetical protein
LHSGGAKDFEMESFNEFVPLKITPATASNLLMYTAITPEKKPQNSPASSSASKQASVSPLPSLQDMKQMQL